MENKILAVVDGRSITERDMERLIAELGSNAMKYANPEGEKMLLTELINQELFYSDALKNEFEAEKEFQKELEAAKIQLLKKYAIKKCIAQAEVTEDELNAHYEEHKASFNKPEMVKASHILVESEAQALSIIDKIVTGTSFEDAAQEFSKCPSSERGGDLGFFSRGQMVPEFENAAFELEKGQMSAPVQTQFGYHIIKAYDKQAPGHFALDEIRYDLLRELTIDKQGQLFTDKVNDLRGEYKIEII